MTTKWKIGGVISLSLVVVVGVTATGLAFSRIDNPGEPQAQPVDYAQSDRMHRPPVSGSPSEMLGQILARIDRSRLLDAALGGPPPGFAGAEGTLPIPPRLLEGKWLYSTVTAPEKGPASLRAIWEADLVAGALRDAVHAQGGPEILGSEIALRLPTGETIPHAAGGIGEVAYQQEFESSSTRDLQGVIRPALARHGLRLVIFETVRADQVAPVVVAVTDDAFSALEGFHEIVNAAFGLPPKYEGYYLEVRDVRGEPIVIQTAAFRSGVGHKWIRQDLDPRRAQSYEPAP